MTSPHPSSQGDLSAQVLRDVHAIEAVSGIWQDLTDRSAPLSPWQRWEFISSWLRHAPADGIEEPAQPRVILVKRGTQPCLLMPLQLTLRRANRMGWLEPIGMPDNIHRPRLGIGPLDPQAYAAALHAIDGLRYEADGLRIDEKTSDDAELALLQQLGMARGWRFRSVPLHPCPYLIIPADWPAYLAGRSSKLRKNLNSSRRRLSALGPLRFARFDSGEMHEALDLIFDITSRSWKSAAHIGLGASAQYRAFFREFAMKMAATGRARAYCLYAGSKPVAATLAFLDGDVYYSTQIAHDAQFDQYSPGTLLEAMEMQALIQEGRFKVFDFLGAALANKLRWTDTVHDTRRVMWLSRSPRALLFDTIYFVIKPRLLAALRRLKR